MPYVQCIPNIIDREFPASVGHWTDDFVWDPGPVMGKENIAKLLFPSGSYVRTTSLSYPYVKVKPGPHSIFFWFYFYWPGSTNYGKLKITVTDGNHEYISSFDSLPYNNWTSLVMAGYTVPSDWNELNSKIVIRGETILHAAVNMYFNDVFLGYWVERGSDHLPLMGVH